MNASYCKGTGYGVAGTNYGPWGTSKLPAVGQEIINGISSPTPITFGIQCFTDMGVASNVDTVTANMYAPAIATSSLSVVQNGAVGTQTFAPGTANAKVGSFVITNPNPQSVTVNSVNIMTNSWSPILVPATMQNLRLSVGGMSSVPVPVVGGNTQVITFPNGITIPSNGSVTVDAFADIASGLPSNSTYYSYSPVSLMAVSGVGVTNGGVAGFYGNVTGQSVVVHN